MATLAVFDVKGDPSDVLRRYDTLMHRLPGEMPAKPLVHVCVPIETGLRIYDVWPSEAAVQDFAQDPCFQKLICDAGLPAPDVEVRPVHRLNW